MFGTFSFSDSTFAESKLKNRNNLEYNIDLEVQTLDKKAVNLCANTIKAMTIDTQHDKDMAIDVRYDTVMNIDTQYGIELLGTPREVGYYNDEIAYLNPWYRWTFNNTLDDSGYGTSNTPRNGTGHGSIAYTSGGGIIPSMPWESIDLNPDDEVRISDSPNINTGTGYTFEKRSISVWAEFDSVSGTDGNGRIIWEQGGTGQWWSIYLHDSNLYTCIGESNNQKGYCSSPVSASTLYLITVTIDLSLESNQMKLYINGSLVSETTTSAGSSLSSHNGNIAWGGPNSSPRNHLNESITANVDARLADGCYWYERALTPREISNIWSTGN